MRRTGHASTADTLSRDRVADVAGERTNPGRTAVTTSPTSSTRRARPAVPRASLIPHAGLGNLVAWHTRRLPSQPADRATQLAAVAFDASRGRSGRTWRPAPASISSSRDASAGRLVARGWPSSASPAPSCRRRWPKLLLHEALPATLALGRCWSAAIACTRRPPAARRSGGQQLRPHRIERGRDLGQSCRRAAPTRRCPTSAGRSPTPASTSSTRRGSRCRSASPASCTSAATGWRAATSTARA